MRIDDRGNVFYDDLDFEVVDAAGNVLLGNNPTNPSGSGITGALVDFVLYGVPNGNFNAGPTGGVGSEITRDNPMPWLGYLTQVSGNSIQLYWVADAASPSGYNLRFVINPGAAGDEAYVEIIVPIGGDRGRALAYALRMAGTCVTATSGSNSFQGTYSYTYLDTSGSVVAGGASGTINLTSATEFIKYDAATVSALSTASTLRIRIGVKRNTATASDSATIDFSTIRLDRSWSTLLLTDQSAPSTYGPGTLSQTNGRLTVAPRGTTATTLALGPVGGFERADLVSTNINLNASSLVSILGGGLTLSGSAGLTLSSLLSLSMSGPFINAAIIRDTISADQNNYAPTGLATCATLVITASGATRTITGFSASGFTEGQIFNVVNTATNSIVFAHSSASSTSGNRIGCVNAASLTIRANGSAVFQYLPTDFPGTPFRMLSVNA